MEGCTTCTSDGTKVTCTVCAAGFYLSADGSACVKGCKILG